MYLLENEDFLVLLCLSFWTFLACCLSQFVCTWPCLLHLEIFLIWMNSWSTAHSRSRSQANRFKEIPQLCWCVYSRYYSAKSLEKAQYPLLTQARINWNKMSIMRGKPHDSSNYQVDSATKLSLWKLLYWKGRWQINTSYTSNTRKTPNH